jgi:tripartite-type tricarboxylate transporter receptor subunit TctC
MIRVIKFATACTLMALAAQFAGSARAQDWPQRPVRIVVITPPGGFPDFAARLLATHMKDLLGQQVVVENKPGAGGNIAATAVAGSPPDGYTLLLTGNNHAINATRLPNPGFDYVKSFAPVGLVATSNMLLVASPTLAAKGVADVLALARAKPGTLSMAVPQIGTPGHLGAELFVQLAKVNMTFVPYSGVAPALPDLSTGRVDLIMSAFPAVMSLVDGNRIKALAVTRSLRSPIMPNIPTIDESGVPGFDVSGWVCLMAPAGTPESVVRKLNSVMREVLGQKEVIEAFTKQGLDVTPSSPDELERQMQAEQRKWAGVLDQAIVK